MVSRDDARTRAGAGGERWVAPVITLLFIALAAWFLVGPDLEPTPTGKPVVVEAGMLDIGPRRTPLGEPPRIEIAGFTWTCMECHASLQTMREQPSALTQHTHIRLDHGVNDRCAYCHHGENRDLLAIRGGTTVPFTESQKLCRQCHGPTYRDWEKGMHGKTTGYWDRTRGEARRFTCVECHDPHAPAYPKFRPLPGPNTLRMQLKPPSPDHHESPVMQADPLRKWQRAAHAHDAVDPHEADIHDTHDTHDEDEEDDQ